VRRSLDIVALPQTREIGAAAVFHLSRFTPDQTRFAEFIACLWQGPVPEDLILHEWIYLQGEPRSMIIVWEGGPDADAYVTRAFGSFGSLVSEEVTNATRGLATCFERDLDGFGDFLRHEQGWTEDEIAAQLDLRRRGLTAATLDEAAAAGRAWQAERS
jgi:hypothetical protein